MVVLKISGYIARFTSLLIAAALLLSLKFQPQTIDTTAGRVMFYAILMAFVVVNLGVVFGIKAGGFRLAALLVSFLLVVAGSVVANSISDTGTVQLSYRLTLVLCAVNFLSLLLADWGEVFLLVFKQMRQRALGTWLTLLSVTLGVALAISIFLMRQAGSALFGQTDYGFDVLVGIGQGSPLDLTLNTVYHIYKSPGNVPYWVYETLDNPNRPPRGSKEFNFNGHVHTAIPIAVGDTYKSRPIVGTPPKMFVSLTDFRTSVDELRDKQSALMNEAADAGGGDVARFASRQSEIEKQFQTIRGEMRRIARETTPLLEQPDTIAPPVPATQPSTRPATEPAKPSGDLLQGDDLLAPSKPKPPEWRYGKPITFIADNGLQAVHAAARDLTAKNGRSAREHQKAVLAALDAVYKSAGAENGPLEYRPDMHYEMAEGRVFHAWKFEAVIGSEVAEKTDLKLGSKFHATHGNPKPNEKPDIHPEMWRVVGVMKPTHTAADRCLYIPLVSFYCIAEHEAGVDAQAKAREGEAAQAKPKVDDDDIPKFKDVYGDELDPDLPHEKGYINVDLPTRNWLISAILVKSRGGVSADDLMFFIRSGGMHENIQAINPASVMREFFDTFFAGSTTILLIIAALVSIVAAVGILVSIYNSVSARNREIAILRALGATRGRVLTLICVEAGLIGLFGAILGLVAGHLLGGVGSLYLSRTLGQGFNWVSTNLWEWIYLVGVVVIALAAGLVPAAKAYRTPVATNLVSG